MTSRVGKIAMLVLILMYFFSFVLFKSIVQVPSCGVLPFSPKRSSSSHKKTCTQLFRTLFQSYLNCITCGSLVANGNAGINTTVYSHDNVVKNTMHVWNNILGLHHITNINESCGTQQNGLFRRLCDPLGHAPCCFFNRCVLRNTSDCKCRRCYDLRQSKFAETHQWRLRSNDCSIVNFTDQTACDILVQKGITHIYFMGDSLIFDVYAGLMIILTSDLNFGTLRSEIKSHHRHGCSGLSQFTKNCKQIFRKRNIQACDSRINISYTAAYNIDSLQKFNTSIRNYFWNGTSTMLVFGIGLHERLHMKHVELEFIRPLLEMFKSELGNYAKKRWPRFLWMNPHIPGALKPPVYAGVGSEENVKKFTKYMEKTLPIYGIYTLNTHDITKYALSFDGTHFTTGVNVLISQMILNFINVLPTTSYNGDYMNSCNHFQY